MDFLDRLCLATLALGLALSLFGIYVNYLARCDEEGP